MHRSLFFLVGLVASASALADTDGTRGTVEVLDVNTPSADTYLQYHGRVGLRTANGIEEYRWGGTSCGSRTLTDAHVQMLQKALESGTRVTPRYQLGQGSALCLVGMLISAP